MSATLTRCVAVTGATAEGVEVTLAVRSEKPLRIEVSEMTYGLPEVPGMPVHPDRPLGHVC